MKVTLGPYRSWIGPYQIASGIFFWVDRRGIYYDEPAIHSRWDYQAEEKFGEWLASIEWLCKFLSWIDGFKKRKIKVHIDPWDTWSMDHTLSHIIHPMLVQLYKTNHGYFHSDPEDVPEIGEGDKDEYGSDSKEYQRYCWIMEELIWTFDQIRDDEKEMQFHKDGKYDIEGHNKYNDRIQNGLRLFGKYFRGLWD